MVHMLPAFCRSLAYEFPCTYLFQISLVAFYPFVHSFGIGEFSACYVPGMTWKVRDEKHCICSQRCHISVCQVQ